MVIYTCNKCQLLYSDFTRGTNCENKYCLNKNICESCSEELGINYSVRECQNCITYGPPNYITSWFQWFKSIIIQNLF